MNDKVNLSAKNPEMVEGPYYAIGGTYRSDVRDGLPGAKLELHIQVLNAADGTPLSGIDIDLWHADAIGRYSGFDANPDEVPADLSNGQIPTNDDTFLRGRHTTCPPETFRRRCLQPDNPDLFSRSTEPEAKYRASGLCAKK